MEIHELTYLSVILRIFFALILGGCLGWERGMKNRAAGLRTHMLVCVGACLIMVTNQYVYQVFGTGDPVRMGAQVVSGIGFLGAGTIIVTRRSQIRGLTTAAGLWAAAGVGLALGIGFYEAAVISAFAVVLVMTLMHRLDIKVHGKVKSIEVYLELAEGHTLGDFLRAARERDVDVFDVERDTITEGNTGICTYMATVRVAKRMPPATIAAQLNELECVSYIYVV